MYPDVIVVGGGVIGLSAAWRLAQRGCRVTLLERGRCCSGASGASLGVLWPPSPLRLGPQYDLHRESVRLYPQFVEELYLGTSLTSGYSRSCCLKIFDNPAQRERAERELRAEHSLVGDQPRKLSILSSAEVQLLEPLAQVLEWGGLLHAGAALVSIDWLLTALRRACEQNRVEIIEEEPVERINVSHGRVLGVSTDKGQRSAAVVLAAAGAWNSELAPEIARFGAVEPVRGQALLLRSEKNLVQNCTMLRGRKIYLIPHGDGTITLGATTEHGCGFDSSNTAGGIQYLLNAASGLLPEIASAAIVRMWAGLRPLSVIDRPCVGWVPGVEGLLVAGGHYKTGVAWSPLTSSAVADLVVAGRSVWDLSPLKPKAAERMPAVPA